MAFNSSCIDGLVYEFTHEIGSFDSGDALCRSTGAIPATFRSEDQFVTAQGFILPLLESFDTSAYIGLIRPFPRRSESAIGSLLWIDGKSLAFGLKFSEFPWERGEPNDQAGVEDCIEVVKSSGEWNDLKCNSLRPILCQRSCDGTSSLAKGRPEIDPVLVLSIGGGFIVILLLVFLISFQARVVRANREPTIVFAEERKDKALSVGSWKSVDLKESTQWQFPRNSDNSISPLDVIREGESQNMGKIFQGHTSLSNSVSSQKNPVLASTSAAVWSSMKSYPQSLAVSVISRASADAESEAKPDDRDSIDSKI